MARTPGDDERQKDFFGAPAPAPKPPGATPGRKRRLSPPSVEDPPDGESMDVQIARMSPSELRHIVATLPDETLAQLTLATIRQLKRRLARDSQRASGSRTSVLERAAQQLIAELGEQQEGDEYDV